MLPLMTDTLWIGTRKGLFALRAPATRRGWKLAGPHFLGHIVHHVVQDPREPRVLVLAARTGHLGPTVFPMHAPVHRAEEAGGRAARVPAATLAVMSGREPEHPLEHMRLFVNSSEARELSAEVADGDTVHVICALSGG